MKKNYFLMLLLAIFVLPQFSISQTVSTFEELELNSTGYWNGSDDAEGFTSGNAFFTNNYNHDYFSWYGFAYSNLTDTLTAGYTNQYSAYAGEGAESSKNYCVAFTFANDTVSLTTPTTVSGVYFTNNTYAALSMRDGDAYTKKFGGADGNDPDWFKISIFGVDDSNNNTDTIDFYLADFRFDDNGSDYIVKDWKWADLTSLGNINKIVFFLSSTDNGDYGMNTPSYFCLDNLNGTRTGINNFVINNNSVTVYPNPFRNSINIDGINDIKQIYVTDISGKLVYNSNSNFNNNQIDLSSLTRGFYFINIKTQNKIITKKIIKQ
ncbi:MAG: DUF4465 domain-containing protein [Bacteroidetes bacterium]|nr:DUF4465 domain-containing protein [Bacteroidota bacterium]